MLSLPASAVTYDKFEYLITMDARSNQVLVVKRNVY